MAADLVKVQAFYDSLGGIVGYQLKCLELIVAAKEKEDSVDEDDGAAPQESVEFLVPQGPNLQGEEGRSVAQRAAADGLRAMPHLSEIYPLGGVPLSPSARVCRQGFSSGQIGCHPFRREIHVPITKRSEANAVHTRAAWQLEFFFRI